MPRLKTIDMPHTLEYRNRDGRMTKAEFLEIDAMEGFQVEQEGNSEAPPESNETKRVYRESRLGKKLLARFHGTTAGDDAEEFAEMMNNKYDALPGSGGARFYSAIVK